MTAGSVGRIEVRRLGVSDRAEAVDVLASAFMDYAVMRYVLSDAGAAYESQLRSLIGFFCDKRLTRGWPVLGATDADGRLAGVAGVNPPAAAATPADYPVLIGGLRGQIGDEAVDRLNAYEEESDQDAPTSPHFFLGIIGTRPDRRGAGYGRVLIDAIVAMSEADPISEGVCLNTETATNVPFYEHMGFRVIAERDIGDVHTWCMYRLTHGTGG